MKIRAVQREGFALLSIDRDVTFQNWKALRQQLEKALSVFPGKYIALDLESVGFINSSGIGVFVEILKVLRQRGGGLYITRLQEPVRRLFEKTRLHEDIIIVDDEDALTELLSQEQGD